MSKNSFSYTAKDFIYGLTGISSVKMQVERQDFNVDAPVLRVGILSDTQLPPEEKKNDGKYRENLRKSFAVLKEQGVHMILFAGDIGDLGTRYAFHMFNEVFDEVFGENKPILQIILGNHDYWMPYGKMRIDFRAAFCDEFGVSPWTHYVVNGFHFIGASPADGNMTKGYKKVTALLDEELKFACEDAPDKPVFVMTHNQPENTSYGSEDWGDVTLGEVLSKYPNAVNLSGHVHYSVLDERSIWQGDYTVINTQSVSYTEMEVGKVNGTIPPNAEATPMGYILEISQNECVFKRYNFATGKEEKSNMRWVLPLPYSKQVFKYTSLRAQNNKPPKMLPHEGEFFKKDGKNFIRFSAGEHDDFVHSYKLVIDSDKTQLYFSDFYNGIEQMKKEVVLELKDIASGKHKIEVFAVDSFGAQSENCAVIENVNI